MQAQQEKEVLNQLNFYNTPEVEKTNNGFMKQLILASVVSFTASVAFTSFLLHKSDTPNVAIQNVTQVSAPAIVQSGNKTIIDNDVIAKSVKANYTRSYMALQEEIPKLEKDNDVKITIKEIKDSEVKYYLTYKNVTIESYTYIRDTATDTVKGLTYSVESKANSIKDDYKKYGDKVDSQISMIQSVQNLSEKQ